MTHPIREVREDLQTVLDDLQQETRASFEFMAHIPATIIAPYAIVLLRVRVAFDATDRGTPRRSGSDG